MIRSGSVDTAVKKKQKKKKRRFKPACAYMTDSLHFHFKKNKKQDNQTAFAGSKKKKIIQEWRNAMLHTIQFLL